jgi:LacI family transcriptional regulator
VKPSARRVLLLIETSKIYGRMLLKGIGRYALTHGRWSMCVDERGLFDRPPDWLRHWRGDGVIFRSNGRAMVDAIRATGLPAVDTNSAVVDHGFPLAYPDERAVARVAVAHFAERGFRHFAFCSMERARWVQWRRRAYVEHVRGLAHECHCHDAPIRRHQGSWDQQLRQLARWVAELPKPVAVLAANDICGMRLIDACRLAGEAVPDQVAVLGVDNDEILCTLTTPPLSSIDLNAEQIGYEAATRLDRMMRGAVALPPLNLVVPNGVVQRQSTNALAIEDEQLVAALEFIREHACEGISVTDVVKPARLSRRVLEQRFAATLNRTPKQEIMRTRIERAKQLLRETDLPVTQIAGQMGYASFNYFCTVFRREVGISPLAFRRRHGRSAGRTI